MDRDSTATRAPSIRLAGVGLGLLAVSLLFVYSVRSQAGGLEVGYAVLTGRDGSRVPVASALFSFRSGGVLVSEAGVAALEPIRRGRIFVEGTDTGLALANPFGAPTTVTFTLRNSGGDIVCQEKRTIEAEGHLAKNIGRVDELFAPQSCASAPPIGSVTFETDLEDPPIAPVTIRSAQNARGDPLFATLPVVPLEAETGAASTVQGASSVFLLFPQIGAGKIPETSIALTTQIILINPGGNPIRGEIQLFGSTGQPLELELQESDGSSSEPAGSVQDSVFAYQLAGDGVYRGTLTHSGEARSGYAVITSDSGERAGGTAVFQYRDADGKLISEAGVGDVRATRRARIYVDTDQTDTGIAIAAFGQQGPVQLTVQLRDRYGDLLQEVTLPDLVGGGHLAEFVSQMFSGLTAFRGVMEIQADAEFYPVTLKLTNNQLSQPILTTLPLADLDHPLEANSVVIPQLGFGQSDGLELSTRLILIDQDDPELNPSASGSFGVIRFRQSSPNTLGGAGVPLQVPLFGENGNEFEYRIDPGGANRLRPGDSASISQIVLPSVSGGEVPVAVGREATVRPQIIDSTGELRDDFQFSFSSLDPQVASIDALGRIRAHEEGFSTLAIEAAGSLETATITVTETGDVSAGLDDVRAASQDTAGRIYLASSNQHSVWRAEAGGLEADLFAGTKEPGLTDDVPRLQAQFDTPSFLALTKGRNPTLYVSDSANHRIRTVAIDAVSAPFEGTVGTLAVNLDDPQGVALDNFGHLWVADRGSRTIQRIGRTDGVVETIAGQGGSGCLDGPAELALSMEPIGIAKVPETLGQQLGGFFGPSELSLVVADKGCNSLRLIRCESPNCTPRCDQDDEECSDVAGWQVETIRSFGTAQQGLGPLTAGPLPNTGPTGVAVDPTGNIFFSFSEPETSQVKTLLTTGQVVVATQSGLFTSPEGLDISQSGRLLVADSGAAREIVYGAPQITDNVSPVGDQGGEEVTIRGRNFAPDSLVVIRGEVIRDLRVTDTSTIQFTAPPLPSGLATLTVQNRGGLAQAPLFISPPSLEDLSPGEITTVAGGSVFTGDGGPSQEAALRGPSSIAIDPDGNIFFTDTDQQRIRRIDAITGIITTVAGVGVLPENLSDSLGDGGPALAAALAFPTGMALDAGGNVFFAEEASDRVRRLDAVTGIIDSVAGGGNRSPTETDPLELGDGGPAREARLNGPKGVVVDVAGNILIADSFNHRVRKVDTDATITTVAGGGVCQDPDGLGDGGPATEGCLSFPTGLAVDSEGNLFIADSFHNRIRMIDTAGIISTVVGPDVSELASGGFSFTTTGTLKDPRGVAIDADGNLLIADTGANRIRHFDRLERTISTVAGTGVRGFSGDQGPALEADLSRPGWVAVDGAGNLFIADTGNARVRRVEPRGKVISSYAGEGRDEFLGDGEPATAGALRFPSALAFNQKGDLFIADSSNHRIRRVEAATKEIGTVAGNGRPGFSGDGEAADQAMLSSPAGLDLDAQGNLFIADTDNSSIRRVDAITQLIDTIIRGEAGNQFDPTRPRGIAFDSQGSLFLADTGNHRILAADLEAEQLFWITGTGERGAGPDSGLALEVLFDAPFGVESDLEGNLYIADSFNHRIRKFEAATGMVSTVAGDGTPGFQGDGGLAILARLNFPTGLTLDSEGNLLIADSFNQRIRWVDAQTGIISSVAGVDDFGFSGDGGLASQTRLNFPGTVRFDADGNLFIADRNNHRIRAIKGPVVPSIAPEDLQLVLRKDAEPDPVNPGERLTYSLSLTNRSPKAVSSLQVTDSLPAGVRFVSAQTSSGVCAQVTQQTHQVHCDLGTLDGGGQTSVTIEVDVEESAAGTVLINSATCQLAEDDPGPCQASVSTRVRPAIQNVISNCV